MKIFTAEPGGKLSGEPRVASDKSISHRAVMLSALAAGETDIINPLDGADARATIAAVRACGVEVEENGNTLRVRSSGRLTPPAAQIDCGNSGTLMRLFCGIAAGWNVPCTLVGDSSLMRRPMRRVCEPLTLMGANIAAGAKGTPPIVISKNESGLRGILYNNKLSSAQVKSAILLAALRGGGATVIAEPVLSRDHTERMLESFGIALRRSDDGGIIEVGGGGKLRAPGEIPVPADVSSAMFFAVAAAITPGSEILLRETGVNPTRTGGLDILMRMGADIDMDNRRMLGAEPVADVRVRGGELHGIDITPEMVPAAIDDLPALLVAAACARGVTRLSGARELRYKESDRIAMMSEGLRVLEIACEERDDGIVVEGKNGGKPVFSGGSVDSGGDHRIAMAFCMAAARARGAISVRDCDNVGTSFPNFIRLANACGMRVSAAEEEAPEK